MLGEDHSLVNDFPALKDKIAELNKIDEVFAKDAQQYHKLDKEIRELELDNAPIDDDVFHQMKHDRAALKDTLYQRLIA